MGPRRRTVLTAGVFLGVLLLASWVWIGSLDSFGSAWSGFQSLPGGGSFAAQQHRWALYVEEAFPGLFVMATMAALFAAGLWGLLLAGLFKRRGWWLVGAVPILLGGVLMRYAFFGPYAMPVATSSAKERVLVGLYADAYHVLLTRMEFLAVPGLVLAAVLVVRGLEMTGLLRPAAAFEEGPGRSL